MTNPNQTAKRIVELQRIARTAQDEFTRVLADQELYHWQTVQKTPGPAAKKPHKAKPKCGT